MLFRIEGTDVYMFGSIHFGQPFFYPLPAPVEAAFTSAQQVWFEARSDSDTFPRRAKCPEGRTLDDYVSSKTLNKLRDVAPRVRMDFEKLRMMKPWGVSIELAVFLWASASCISLYGVDDHFKKRANDSKQPVHYLETPDEQLDFIDSAPIDQQEEFLARGIFRLADAKQETLDMLIAWKKSDLASLEAIQKRNIQKHPFVANLTFGRNKNWLPKLKSLAESGIPAFVCAGAFHFVGDESLPILMKKTYGLNLVQIPLGRTIR